MISYIMIPYIMISYMMSNHMIYRHIHISSHIDTYTPSPVGGRAGAPPMLGELPWTP